MEKVTSQVSSTNEMQPLILIKAITTIGIPAAIAIYLVFILASRIETNVVSVSESIKLHSVDSSYIIKQNDSHIRQLNALKQIMQQICANTARTSSDRSNCFNQTQ